MREKGEETAGGVLSNRDDRDDRNDRDDRDDRDERDERDERKFVYKEFTGFSVTWS